VSNEIAHAIMKFIIKPNINKNIITEEAVIDMSTISNILQVVYILVFLKMLDLNPAQTNTFVKNLVDGDVIRVTRGKFYENIGPDIAPMHC